MLYLRIFPFIWNTYVQKYNVNGLMILLINLKKKKKKKREIFRTGENKLKIIFTHGI